MTESLDTRKGVVSGFLLRVIRATGTPPVTREYVAERLGITADYYAGMETGRRPLSNVRIEQSLMLRQILLRAACDPDLLALLDTALEADMVIDHAVRVGDGFRSGDIHPLDSWVLRRQAVEMIAWPLGRRVPAWMPDLTGTPVTRVRLPERPELDGEARRRFFAHLRCVADATIGRPTMLLRRQALYLLSFDTQPDASGFLVHHRGRLPYGLSGWSEQWPAARSLAASITRHGDRTVLLDFITRGLADDDRAEFANLNYYAYWVGEGTSVQRDDTFMPAGLGSWRGNILLHHLTERLDGQLGYVDLTVHTLWALVAAKPHLLAEDPSLRLDLQARVEGLLETKPVSPQALSELAAIRYALKLHR
jgi:hypothetical protein